MKVSVIGLGYVGQELCKNLAEVEEYDVVAVEKSNVIKKMLGMQGVKYRVEGDPASIADSDFYVLCVATPLTNGVPNDHHVIAATKQAIKYGKENSIIIVESTVAIDTLYNEIIPIAHRAGMKVAYSPERINPNSLTHGMKNTSKIVAGDSPETTSRVVDFYSKFVHNVVPTNDIRAAEAAKLLENSYRLLNIAFINEFATACRATGIDVNHVIDLASTKEFGFQTFRPSSGAGGHCIPVDPAFLTYYMNKRGSPMKLLEQAFAFNEDYPRRLLQEAEQKYGSFDGKRVIVIGIAYKPNTSDHRNSPGYSIYNTLKSRGVDVFWNDDEVKYVVPHRSTTISNSFDVALLTVKHDSLDLKDIDKSKIIDLTSGNV